MTFDQYLETHPAMQDLKQKLQAEFDEIEKSKIDRNGIITGISGGVGSETLNVITADLLKNTSGLVTPNNAQAKDQFRIRIDPNHMVNGGLMYAENTKAKMLNVVPGYEALAEVLEKALDQAQNGKGNERHQVDGAGFKEQPICELTRLYGTGYPFGQAAKKAHETNQLVDVSAKVAELLGAIVYLAAAAIVVQEK